MQKMIEPISHLYKTWKGSVVTKVDVLPESGSERRYFRLHCGEETVIGTFGANVKENETFLYFTDHFYEKGLPVPQILAVNDERTIYLQQDLGSVSLLNVL